MRSASGSATEMGVRVERPLLVEPRERLRELLLRLRAEALEVAHLVLGERLARRSSIDCTPSSARSFVHRLGAEPLDAQERDDARRVLRAQLLELRRPCRVSSSSRILAAVLLPMPWIFCSSLAVSSPRSVACAAIGLRGALVGADAERLRVALVEHGELGELAEHVEDVLFRVGHRPWCSLGRRGDERGSRGPLDRRARGPRHAPEQAVLLARGEAHEARRRPLLPRRSRRARSRGIRDRPHRPQALRRRRRGRGLLPEARARERGPPWLRTATLSFPSGRTAEEVVVDDAAGLAWVVNLGCIELHPHPVRAGDLDHPDELRVDLDPGPGRRLGRRAARGARGEGAARGARPARLAEDERLARDARERPHRAALDVHRGAPRGAGPRARDRAARARRSRRRSGGRRSGTASSSTTTRTPRTARPARPTRCARCPTRACRRRSRGTRSPTAIRRTSRC